MCRQNLTAWAIEALEPFGQTPAAHHILLLNHLQKVANGEINRLMVLMPPGSAKSTYCSVLFPAWMYAQRDYLDIIGASHGSELAEDFSAKTQGFIRQNRHLLQYDLASENVKRWRTTNGGFYRAAGIGGSITGRRADGGIIDDPLRGAADAESLTIRDGQWDWYQAEFYTRLKPGAWIVFITTRWNEDDLAGRALGAAAAGGDQWVVLKLPAICDSADDPLGRSIGAALWPQWQDEKALAVIRQNVGEYVWGCTPGETPILMSDWTTKPISEVRPGDNVIGFETGSQKVRAKLVEATVNHVMRKLDTVCDLTMASGRKVRCTADHRWYTQRLESHRRKYDIPKSGKRGRPLMFTYAPLPPCNQEDQRDWDYLAGIIDGEGHVGDSALYISQAIPINEPTANRIRSVLRRLDIPFNERLHGRRGSPPRWHPQIDFVLGDIRNTYRRLLTYTCCAKSEKLRKALLRRGHMFIRERDPILAITAGATENVYALETTTGNYIAWGYASSNSLYQQDPKPRGASFFNIDDLLVLEPSGLLDALGQPLRSPIPMPAKCDTVFAVVDTAIKSGQEHNSTAVTFYSYSRLVRPSPTLILDWDIVQIEGAAQEAWLPSVHARGEELARICGARGGYIGAMIEDKATGTVLIQQSLNEARKTGKRNLAHPIDSVLTAMGKEERALAAAPYVIAGNVKITEEAYGKTKVHKGRSANHLISQVTDFRLGSKQKDNLDLLDTFCYGVLITCGTGSGERKGI